MGGIIGYQRTYTAAQLNGKAVETLMPNLQDGTHVPKETLRSANGYCLTIKGKDDAAVNNIPIAAGWYAGGVVGYCERDSYLILKDCKNTGNLSLASGVGEGDGVSLGDFVTSSEVRRSLSADAGKTRVHFVGGIIGVNLENQIIDHCTNTGNMSGSVGIGGIVGLNAGYIYDCTLSGNFGSASLSYLGGITALNIHSADGTRTYEGKTYTTGTVENCSTAKGRTISGNSDVGGIVGWNLDGGILKDNTSAANVTGRGDYVGGFAGRNSGLLQLKAADAASDSKTVQSSQGQGIGGIVGINEASGTIRVIGTADANGELVVIGKGVTVTGRENAGGIAGINLGTLGDSSGPALTSSAKLVRASKGMAGGVVGTTGGDLSNVVNRSELVTADEGTAGGITAVNTTGKTVSSCKNYGPVRSSNGYAGGIVADNKGTVADCTVAGTGSGANVTSIEIYSRGVDSIGAICALNSGTVKNSVPGSAVVLRGSAAIYGGIVGTNTGTVTDTTMAQMPEINSTSGNVTVGGAVGQNEGTVNHVKTEGISFAGFQNYRYLGGIVGTNGLTKGGENGALVQNCVFSGTIREKSGAAGNSYGGIAGINGGRLESNSVGKLTLDVQGVYTATSTSTTAEKESLSSYAGGITGKNEQYGVIRSCTLKNRADSSLTAAYGMLGGVTGFNKGAIELSGSSVTPDVMTDDVLDQSKTVRERLSLLDQKARAQGLYADQNEDWVNWTNNAQVENLTYHKSNKKVSADRMNIRMTTNGNLGGIAAYNATTGSLQKCVSGNWFLVNKSNTLGVGTGGIIGMNESEKDLGYLVNGAFVGRQLTNADTNRFAGGIIGNQNNTTTGGWTISYSVNYGTVYCYRTHYSGGIMGQWTGTGGTIENCRNYGTLQTSHQAAWVGASGGIVAQLYHAYKDNEYNIIGCGNYGSIYKKKASSDDSGANDSAGILGNITNYEMAAGQTGAPYTVQILDCFNGPGVEIYSSSMASGIFGFLSCDNVAGKANNVAVPQIRRSTETTTIRIERCRNFAYVLKGNNYYGGIFGDRYGGWSDHTIVKDNVSVNPTKDYHKENGDGRYPTYARGIGSQGGVGDIPAEDRKNNYYVDNTWGYDSVVLSENTAAGSGSAGNGYSESDIGGKYTQNLFFMKDQTRGLTCLVSIPPKSSNGTMTTIYGASDYIDNYGNIRDQNENKKGEVLYYVDGRTYQASNLSSEITVDPENLVFLNARTSYYRLEGIENGKILAPASATAKVEDGRVTMEITPAGLPGSTTGELSDPFMYRVRVTAGGQSTVYNLHTEKGSFELPAEASGEVTTIEVQAVSMYEEVGESDWITANVYEISEILPEPEVRVELVPYGNSSNRYHAYRFKLENLEEYNRQQNGGYLYADWQVIIKVNGKTITLNRNMPEADTTMESDGGYVFQMTAQASDPRGKLTASGTVSTSVALPWYRPAMALSYVNNDNPVLTRNITVTGTTQEDMTITVDLDATGQKGVDTPPVYRIEILGDWTDQDGKQTTDAVLASRNLLTVSAGKATVTFTNLPEYISRAENMRVRIWYAMSGLGPVYAYTEDVPEAEANVKELTGITTETQDDGSETERETWKYISSTTLKNTGNYFSWSGQGQYFYTSDQLWTWLEAPELYGVDGTLEPEYGTNGELYYAFRWKGNDTTEYEVSLVGIDRDGREVVISSTQTIRGNTWRVDGTDWNYTQVRLKVTQKGSSTGTGTIRIGRASTGTYKVKPRLESPAQPAVTIFDENELNYRISWSSITSEDGCTGYQLYIRTMDADGNPGPAKALGEPVGIEQKKEDGTYEVTRDLEDYEGQTVVVYLVAKADANGDYLDSLSGITNEVVIPGRLNAPQITWANDWNYDRTQPVTADHFRNTDGSGEGLQVTATAADDASTPQGGSAYLLRAYIYDSETDAKDAADKPLAIYPASYASDGTPVQMEQTADPKVYDYALEDLPLKYAGKWIVFYARISSGGGSVSSAWSQAGTPFRLPCVKLDTPDLDGQNTEERNVTVNVKDKPGLPDTTEEWDLKQNVLSWSSVDSADLYELSLEGIDAALAGDYRILETEEAAEDGTIQPTIEVQHRVTATDEDGNVTESWEPLAKEVTAEDGSLHFTLNGYETTVNGSYASTGGEGNYSMDLSAELTAVRNADSESWSYKLKLPDAVSVTAKDGSEVDAIRLTRKVTLQANVQDNLEEPLSEAYVESDQSEISFQQD